MNLAKLQDVGSNKNQLYFYTIEQYCLVENKKYHIFCLCFILYQAQSSLNHCGNFLSDKNNRVLFT